MLNRAKVSGAVPSTAIGNSLETPSAPMAGVATQPMSATEPIVSKMPAVVVYLAVLIISLDIGHTAWLMLCTLVAVPLSFVAAAIDRKLPGASKVIWVHAVEREALPIAAQAR